MEPWAPLTTRVAKRADGPIVFSAATAVSSFALEAGTKPEPACRENSTEPDSRSVTTSPTCRPSALVADLAESAAANRRRCGAGPWAPAGISTEPGTARPVLATRGICHRASRAGSMLATATPAPRVNTLSIASAASAVTRARLVTTGPLTRCLTCQMRARLAYILALASHHCHAEGGEEWSST